MATAQREMEAVRVMAAGAAVVEPSEEPPERLHFHPAALAPELSRCGAHAAQGGSRCHRLCKRAQPPPRVRCILRMHVTCQRKVDGDGRRSTISGPTCCEQPRRP